MSEEPEITPEQLKQLVDNPLGSDIVKDGIIYAGINLGVGAVVAWLGKISEDMD